MKNNIKLFHGDAYKIISELIKENIKVDHIITDPPYNISKENNFHTLKKPRAGVDFGEWDKGEFDLYSWIPQYCKLLNKNGSIIIFCSYKFISYIVDVLESADSGMVVKDVLVWQKSNPMPRNINRRYVQDLEFAIWAVKKNSKWIFNKKEDSPYMRSVFNYPLVAGKERTGHPTQKSLRLMEDIISIHTNEEDLILDPFMGSGTTGAAAINLNRKFIGIELDDEFFKISSTRLQK